MNSHAPLTAANTHLADYLAGLPLPAAEREALAQAEDFGELHRRLAGQAAATADETVALSAARRLELGGGGRLEQAGVLDADAAGRVRLAAARRCAAAG